MGTTAVWFGASLIAFGGVLQGTFAVPMKYARNWKHENIWFVFVLTGLLIFPWIVTTTTMPNLVRIYGAIPWKSGVAIVLFGVGWGIGVTLVGVALRMLGIGLGYAIVLGLSAVVGSLLPLLVLNPERVSSPEGHLYFLGISVMLIGIAIASVAGSLRERSEHTQGTAGASAGGTFVKGLTIAIAAGVLSAMLNFSYAFGVRAIEIAHQFGASDTWASNVVAAPATTGGFLANLLYCGYMMRRNQSTNLLFKSGSGSHWLFGATMGAFWFGGLVIYGIGVNRMGAFGTVVGWPLLMGAIILSSNVAGLATGEWVHAGVKAKGYLFCGSILIVTALVILAIAQNG